LRELVNGDFARLNVNADKDFVVDEVQETSKLPEVLQEALTEEKFRLAIETAKQMDPDKDIPEDLRERYLAELNSWSPERIAEVLSEMEKPTLNIVTANSFEEKVAQMNRNKHYEDQNDVYVAQGDDEPYHAVKSPKKARAYLDDGMPKKKQIKGAPITLEARREFELKRTGDKNLDLVGPHRSASLIQQSLIEAEQTGDNSKIIDFDTATVLNPKNLTGSKFVAYADFPPDSREVRFDSYNPYYEDGSIRGRASVQVLEF